MIGRQPDFSSNGKELDTVSICVIRVEHLCFAYLLQSGARLQHQFDWHLVEDLSTIA